MSRCLATRSDGSLVLASPEIQECSYVVLSRAEHHSYSQGITIDKELYTTVSGWILVSFVSGHVLGRILKGLGKG